MACLREVKVNKDMLAEKLRKNWMAKSGDVKEVDDSLTNLNWLHSMNPMQLDESSSDVSSPGQNKSNTSSTSSNPPSLESYQQPHYRQWAAATGYNGYREGASGQAEYRFAASKPPYSYATMICMAMRELGKPKITLSDIYSWIMENFTYYRLADTSWQNSVRHNLSLNKCFEKVPRRKDEPGKGGFWRINPKYADMLENGVMRRRRSPAGPPPNPSTTRTQQDHHRSTASIYSSHLQQDRRLFHQQKTQDTTSPPIASSRHLATSMTSLTTVRSYSPCRRPSRLLHVAPAATPLDYTGLSLPRRREAGKLRGCAEEYRTTDSNDKVVTQMREFHSLSSDPLNHMCPGRSVGFLEGLLELGAAGGYSGNGLPIQRTPTLSSAGSSSSTGGELSFPGELSPGVELVAEEALSDGDW